MRFTGTKTKLLGLALAAVFGRSAAACSITTTPLMLGETTGAYAARIEAEQTALQEYESKHSDELALDEQRSLWELNPIVFLARVERIKVDGRIYPRPRPHIARTVGRVPPPIPLEPTPITMDPHPAYLVPIKMIKGDENVTPAWHWVGERNSCGSNSDGDLGWATPGDEMVIFAQHPQGHNRATKTMVELKELSLTGVARSKMVEPRVLHAVGTPPSSK